MVFYSGELTSELIRELVVERCGGYCGTSLPKTAEYTELTASALLLAIRSRRYRIIILDTVCGAWHFFSRATLPVSGIVRDHSRVVLHSLRN